MTIPDRQSVAAFAATSSSPTAMLQMRQYQCDIRGRDPADPARLCDADGPDAGQLFAGLVSQLSNPGEIEVRWNALFRQPLLAINLLLLTRHIARVPRVIFDLQTHFFGSVTQFGQPLHQCGPFNFRPSQVLGQRHALGTIGFQESADSLDFIYFFLQSSPTAFIDESNFTGRRSQPSIGIVLAQ